MWGTDVTRVAFNDDFYSTISDLELFCVCIHITCIYEDNTARFKYFTKELYYVTLYFAELDCTVFLYTGLY